MGMVNKQHRFMVMVAKLIIYADSLGYEVSGGDLYRDKRCPYGSDVSLHRKRLAIDLNLFKDGEFLQKTRDHLALGLYWEKMGGSWGGRFESNPDGNHYSLEHDGVR